MLIVYKMSERGNCFDDRCKNVQVFSVKCSSQKL